MKRELPRKDNVVVMCSWCNKLEVAVDDWREVEEAIQVLETFQAETLPKLSHGMCRSCHTAVSDRIKIDIGLSKTVFN